MNTTYLRKARAMFTNQFASTSTQRHNIRAWVRMVRLLGSNWKGLPVHIERVSS